MTPALVPELLVTDLDGSLKFWCGLIGFSMSYARPEERFAYLTLGTAHVMLEEKTETGRYWITGDLSSPRGRGINFQIEVDTITRALERLAQAKWQLYLAPEEKWYRRDDVLLGNKQFLVQDPDGYLLRLFESLGERAAA